MTCKHGILPILVLSPEERAALTCSLHDNRDIHDCFSPTALYGAAEWESHNARIAVQEAAEASVKRTRSRNTIPVNETLLEACIARYNEGENMTALASEYGVDPGELSDALKANGVVIRKGRRTIPGDLKLSL